jgi:hypothetical protein
MSRNQCHSRNGVDRGFAKASQTGWSISEILLIQEVEYVEPVFDIIIKIKSHI